MLWCTCICLGSTHVCYGMLEAGSVVIMLVLYQVMETWLISLETDTLFHTPPPSPPVLYDSVLYIALYLH